MPVHPNNDLDSDDLALPPPPVSEPDEYDPGQVRYTRKKNTDVPSVDQDLEEDDEEEIDRPKTRTKSGSLFQGYPKEIVSAKPETLEDLFSLFPHIGDDSGDFKIRISREKPKQLAGQNIFGVLGDMFSIFTIDEVAANYGGGEYTVAVLGPTGAVDTHGNKLTRQIKSVSLKIPGLPKLPGVPVGDDMNRQMPNVGSYGGPNLAMPSPSFPVPAQVQMKAMEREERREEKQETVVQQSYVQAAETTRTAMADIKQMAEAQVNDFRQQLAALQASLGEKDKDIRRLNEALAKESANASSAQRDAAEAKRSKEAIEEELRRSKEDVSRRMEDLVRQHQSAQEDLRRRLDEDRSRIERESSSEKERIREEARNREQMYRDEAERRLTGQKDAYENRLADLKLITERDLASVREARDREIRSVEQQAKSQIGSLDSNTKLQITLMESQLVRVQGELDRTTKKYEELRTSSMKDPMTMIKEATELSQMIGYVHSSEVKGEGDEGPFDWKKSVAQAAMSLIEKVPQITAEVSAMRQQSAQQRVLQQGGGVQQLPPGPRRPRMIPPPQWQNQVPQQVPGILGNVKSAASLRPMYQPPPQHIVQEAPQQVVANPQQPLSQPPPAWAPQESQAAPEGQQAPSQANINEQGLLSFINHLEESIRGKVVPPGLFAQTLVDNIGHETAVKVLESLSPDKLFELIEAKSGDSVIMTRDGQRYVRDVFTAVRQIVGA